MSDWFIREAKKTDLEALLELYTFLHGNPFPVMDGRIENIWNEIVEDKNHHVLLGFTKENSPEEKSRAEKLAASCVIIIVRNLTRGQRPYALVENVITHPDYRKKGYGSLILNEAKNIAVQNGCYKIMLLTGSKQESTFNFYRQAGYNAEDKAAFVQWLE